MQINQVENIANNTNFSGISVNKRCLSEFERKVVINAIKSKLLRGKVTDNRGRDLYQKLDRKGYNFFLIYGWQNGIDVYIDKVKTDKTGKKQYKHEYYIGSFNSKNVDTFEESVRKLKNEEKGFMLNTILHLVGIASVLGLSMLAGLLFKK